jgi:hypothetical protein
MKSGLEDIVLNLIMINPPTTSQKGILLAESHLRKQKSRFSIPNY